MASTGDIEARLYTSSVAQSAGGGYSSPSVEQFRSWDAAMRRYRELYEGRGTNGLKLIALELLPDVSLRVISKTGHEMHTIANNVVCEYRRLD